MKRLILGAIVVLSMGTNGWSQQDPQYSQFMYDKLSINPGAAGIHGMYCGTVMYRNQWLGFDGSPKTILLNLDGGISAIHGGVGLTFYNDKLGFETNNIIRLSYSWHQSIQGHLLGIGLSAGYASKSFNADWQYIDPDNVIPGNNISEGAMDLNFGLYFQARTGNTYGGISSTHLNGANLGSLNLDIARHYWVMAGHKQDITPVWAASGDLIVQSDFASTQFALALRGWYKNMLYGGVSYRHQDAIYPMFGFHKQLPSPEGSCSKMFITTGLAYDVTLSDLSNYSNGSMELFVKFCFKPCINPVLPRPIDVRFLGT